MQPPKLPALCAAILMLLPVAARASSTAALVAKGNSCYSRGKYEDALKAYDQASAAAPKSPWIFFDQGAAYYRVGAYAKAEDAWQKAAIKSEDPRLQAKAFFNLGNCAFQQARRQEESHPQKALADCTRSIKCYQQSLHLLQKRPDAQGMALKKAASENIELVRLTMKSILDQLHKKRQEAQKQLARQKQAQKRADDLQKLISRQQELVNRDKHLAQDRQTRKKTKSFHKQIAQMVGDQARLQKETRDAANQLTSSKVKQPDSIKAAGKHLRQAQKFQNQAVHQMHQDHLSSARKNQQAALDAMKKALSSLAQAAGKKGPGKPKPTGRQQASAANRTGKPNPSRATGGSRQQAAPARNPQRAQNTNSAIDQMPGTAQSIIDQEHQYRQQLQQQTAASQGGYQAVGKDW